METKLRIVPGAGKEIEVDAHVAARYGGNVLQALRQLVRDEINDPELLAMLDDPRTALEQFTEDGAGGGYEASLAPTADWSNIVEGLSERTIELGVARTQTGGLGGWCGGRKNSKKKETFTDSYSNWWYDEEPQQVVDHPADYQLTREDVAAIARGKAVFIAGRALAKAEAMCKEMGADEAMWYWTSEAGVAGLITDVIIPEQEVSAGMCSAPATKVLAANRQARRLGRRIVAAGHSHGRSRVFSSTTDHDLMGDLAQERVGHQSFLRKRAAARLAAVDAGASPDAPAGQAAPAPQGDGRHIEATFPDFPDTTVHIAGVQPPADAGMRVELVRESRGLVVTFSTHNYNGEHYFPAFSVRTCPFCQARNEAIRRPEEVTLHVVGPREITEDELRALHRELEAKVHRHVWGGGGKLAVTDASRETSGAARPDDEAGEAGLCDAEPGRTADFEVYHRGSFVGRVAPAVLEEAAFRTPNLAVALGWNEYARKAQGAANNER